MEKVIKMYRQQYTDHSIGVIMFNGYQLYTIEQPWVTENDTYPSGMPFESCIPYGRYEVIKHSSAKFGEVWALVNPELGVMYQPNEKRNDTDRYACLLHRANYADDVSGCIGLGVGVSMVNNGKRAMVTQSRIAFEKCHYELDKATHLEIISYGHAFY